MTAYLIFGSYALLLLISLIHHEVWRDEVRAWSVARSARDPLELIGDTLNNEGHPALWYVLLWIGCRITDNPIVLKITSYVVAIGMAALYFFLSPYRLWIRALFLFGLFPLNLYSVVSRNYGIGVLLMFLLATEYSRRQRCLPWRAGLYNALLANTNVYGAICSVAFLFVPPWIEPDTRQRRRHAWGTVTLLTALGLTLSAYTVWPRAGNMLNEVSGPSVDSVFSTVRSVMSDDQSWTGLILTGADWKQGLSSIVPQPVVWWVNAIALWALLLGLFLRVRWVMLSYGAAYLAAGLFSGEVYPALPRHVGMLWACLLTLLWIVQAREPTSTRGVARLCPWLIGLCLLAQAVVGLDLSLRSFSEPYSQSKNAGTFLAREYPTAILLGEPDYHLESLRYYATNPIYVVREQRFRDFVTLTGRYNRPVTLRELMSAAARLHRGTGQIVLLSLPVPIERLGPGVFRQGFGRDFTITSAEIYEFQRRFSKVEAFVEPPVTETFVFYRELER